MRTDLKRIALSLTLLALPLAACGGDDDESGDGGGSDTTGGAAAGVVQVIGSDGLDFDADEYTAEAGEVTFHYDGGAIAHSLVVEGHEEEMRLLIQGDEDEGSLELEAGEYRIYCDIPGHESAGMQAALIVE